MRINGGIIGIPNQSNTTFATGVWGWDEKFLLRTKDSFPNVRKGYDLYNIDTDKFSRFINILSTSYGFTFSPDGLNFYLADNVSAIVTQYKLRVAWDIRTIYRIVTATLSIPVNTLVIRALYFKSDGSKLFVHNSQSARVEEYLLSTAWDITTTSFNSVGYTVSTQETALTSLTFKPDGTRMYIIGTTNDTVYEYILSTPWSLSSVTVGGNYSATVQSATPSGIRFNGDGTLLFISDSSSNRIYQYNVSTPWQANTASYSSISYTAGVTFFNNLTAGLEFKSDFNSIFLVGNTTMVELGLSNNANISSAYIFNNTFSVATQDSTPEGLAFKSDGTTMYIVGSSTDRVYQYSLDTPWDIKTASNSSISFSVSGQDTTPSDIAFKTDGTKMYILGDTGNDLNQYSLSNAWNVSSATFDSTTLSFATANVGETNPRGITFKPDGTKLYVIGSLQDNVYQYSLSSAWDISTATYDNILFSASQDTVPQGIAFTNNGSLMYTTGSTGDKVYKYSLTESWNVATASYTGNYFSTKAYRSLTFPVAVTFSSDESIMYITDSGTDAIYAFSLNTPGDINYLVDYNRYEIGNLETAPTGVKVHPDGTSVYLVGTTTDRVYQYDLSVPFSLSSINYNGSNVSVSGQDSAPQDLAFKPDGTKMYVLGGGADRVSQYTLSDPWNVSSATFDSKNFSVSAQDAAPTGIFFKPDGTKMYSSGASLNNVHQYSLSTAWDISTASFEKTKNLQLNSQGLAFREDGGVMYLLTTANIHQYPLSTNWDIGTINTSDVKIFYSAVQLKDTSFTGIDIANKGRKLYLLGETDDYLYEVDIN
jgi:sugar lactone lactonase YvrE